MSNKSHKYRLAMLDDITLREVFHIRVSLMGAISFLSALFIVIVILLSLLIVYTPLRNVLPGYSASLRSQLVQESARVDSLQTSLAIQRQYLDMIKQLTAGDIQKDSVHSLDSLELVERTQILEQRNEQTDAFMAQYEQEERDRLLLFDNAANHTAQQLYRPLRGVVVQSAQPEQHIFGITLRAAKNENVLAVMRGTLISVERMANNTFSIMLQNGTYMTVYHNVATPLKPQGSKVERGESIGMVDGEHDVLIEMWDDGKYVNPEEVIIW